VEPRIQYAKTEDGVSIAYTVFGEGPPIIIPPVLTASHLQKEWDIPARRAYQERLAERATVVRYDPRGVGMSDRDLVDFSLEASTLDLEAVAGQVGLQRFALFGVTPMGSLPLAYAASHPERVTHLVLFRFPLRQFWESAEVKFSLSFADEQWELFTNVFARLAFDWDSPEATPLAALIRASHQSPRSFRAAYDAIQRISPSTYTGQIRVPTLLLHPLSDEAGARASRTLASEIAGAQVAGIPQTVSKLGEGFALFPSAAAIAAIHEFINTAPSASGRSVVGTELDTGVFRTILFTDLEEHTAMMQRLGDAKGREVLREHERITREALRTHGGSEIKTVGDSFMASFSSAQKALECAIALERSFDAQEVSGERLRVRIGINAGEPIAEEDDLFGSSVILAARAKDGASGGEIVVTDVVRQLVSGKGFLFSDRGDVALRGFEDPVRLWELRWREGVE
jgi:class 3 adenylate cyclase/pimeloyl-ACP methyl ester carboxylesterase